MCFPLRPCVHHCLTFSHSIAVFGRYCPAKPSSAPPPARYRISKLQFSLINLAPINLTCTSCPILPLYYNLVAVYQIYISGTSDLPATG